MRAQLPASEKKLLVPNVYQSLKTAPAERLARFSSFRTFQFVCMRIIASVVAALILVTSCKRVTQKDASSNLARQEGTNPPAQTVEACSLITLEEVGAIQGATIFDAKNSVTFDGSYLVSLCYYSSREPNQAISFALTQASAGSAPSEYWKQTFGRFRGNDEGAREERDTVEPQKEGKRTEKEEEEKIPPPRKIDALGEEAFWSGNRFGGALYVLKGNFVLRISVGGGDSEQIKIDKSRALAEKALSRL